jgi:hypothetical protein
MLTALGRLAAARGVACLSEAASAHLAGTLTVATWVLVAVTWMRVPAASAAPWPSLRPGRRPRPARGPGRPRRPGLRCWRWGRLGRRSRLGRRGRSRSRLGPGHRLRCCRTRRGRRVRGRRSMRRGRGRWQGGRTRARSPHGSGGCLRNRAQDRTGNKAAVDGLRAGPHSRLLLQQCHPGAADEYQASDRPGHRVPSVAGQPGRPPIAGEWRFGLRWWLSRIARLPR